jgi:hypothetical protein
MKKDKIHFNLTLNPISAKRIKQQFRTIMIAVLLASLMLGSCKANHRGKSLPKRGAIPCPIKDC